MGGRSPDTGRTAARFRTTSWTLIRRAQARREDLEELLRSYWSPVYAFLRRSGWRLEDAEDLTQSFLADVMLRRDLIGRADPQRRFRSYLLAALRNFATDGWRKQRLDGAQGRTFLPDDPDALRLAEPPDSLEPATAFEHQWAAAVFDRAIRRVEQACRDDGMERQWRAFEARLLHPMLHGCERIPIPALLAELQARDDQEIYDMVQTVKRRFRRAVEEVVAETVDDSEQIDDEIAELRRCLAV